MIIFMNKIHFVLFSVLSQAGVQLSDATCIMTYTSAGVTQTIRCVGILQYPCDV